MKILLLNGPNLDLLGSREPEIYGKETLADVEAMCAAEATALGHAMSAFQSNHEGALIDRVHAAKGDGIAFMVVNAGAFTHTSIALRDALSGVAIPFIEVHISNVHRREPFRHHSYLSDIAEGVIVGLGTQGYAMALQAASAWLGEWVTITIVAPSALSDARMFITCAPFSVSRLPVGSSARMRLGLPTMARAIAARCC